MNALEKNRYTEAWRAFGQAVPRPKSEHRVDRRSGPAGDAARAGGQFAEAGVRAGDAEAIREVRRVRKGAIETPSQLALVRRTVAIP